MKVRGASQEHVESSLNKIGRMRFLIRFRPIFKLLGCDGCVHHIHGVIQFRKHFLFGGVTVVGKLALAVADISGSCNLITDEVIQVADDVQRQVTETIPVRIRSGPKLAI